MSYLSEWDQNIIKDFEKLLSMTEESSEKIDYILQIREKQKIRLIVLMFLVYGFLMIFAFLFIYSGFGEIIKLVLICATSIGFAVCTWIMTKDLFILKKTRRELHVERDIHERLISLLDEQKQRLLEIITLSPVAHALYEIRMRRIDRTDKNVY